MTLLPAGFVLLRGRMTRADRAKVSVFDRGFQYGDALIETLRVDRGRPVALAAHIARLRASAGALGIPLPERDWASEIVRLLARNGLLAQEAWVRLTLTRGPSQRGLLPPAQPEPMWVLSAGPVDTALGKLRRAGVAVVTLDFGRGRALGEHKHAFYLPSIVGKQEAAAAGAFDGLFVAGGAVQGATTANLFARIRDRLVTPAGAGVLPGVTQARVAAAARAAGWTVERRALARRELAEAEELFLTNSLFEVLPVVRCDGKPVGSGRPGPRARTLQRTLLAHLTP